MLKGVQLVPIESRDDSNSDIIVTLVPLLTFRSVIILSSCFVHSALPEKSSIVNR